ncbi:hypothetical protein FOPG_19317 [Fusarium oxysporum f. sp. conglutinans race 2 54008]|nr:hypothetical protein FOPG_19317 [Fusarium oxysporum f. sp. conglutinans race 2 54008]KAI8411476.1 hypothetical protein FOFC_08070 [Fusarium oxysporum]
MPAAISGLPNAPATRCAPFQWYWNAFMTEMEVMDRRRCHLADTATSHNKAKVILGHCRVEGALPTTLPTTLSVILPTLPTTLPTLPGWGKAPLYSTMPKYGQGVPFIVKMALRWFEKVEGKAKKAVVGRSPRIRPGSFTTITFADTVNGISGGAA